MKPEPIRTGKKVEVYVTRRLSEKIRLISKKTGRPLSEVINHLAWLTYSNPYYKIVIRTDQFIKKSRWCEIRMYTRLPPPLIEEYKDVAWCLGVKPQKGVSSGVGFIIGLAADFQLKSKQLRYWTKYFRTGKDYIKKLEETCLTQKKSN